MSRIFITGSADGLGRAPAQTLLSEGHQIVVHVRARERLDAVHALVDQGATTVVGDLSDLQQTRSVAEQASAYGPFDTVIHNAGVYSGRLVLPVNVVAPYVLTAMIPRPERLIYLSSDMDKGGQARLQGLDWSGSRATCSYSDSKLLLTGLARGDRQRSRSRLGADQDGRPQYA
jgi:NAD(P)-dependent dehydrogenase (short-subunit alcohol dehydrogenase family)